MKKKNTQRIGPKSERNNKRKKKNHTHNNNNNNGKLIVMKTSVHKYAGFWAGILTDLNKENAKKMEANSVIASCYDSARFVRKKPEWHQLEFLLLATI